MSASAKADDRHWVTEGSREADDAERLSASAGRIWIQDHAVVVGAGFADPVHENPMALPDVLRSSLEVDVLVHPACLQL